MKQTRVSTVDLFTLRDSMRKIRDRARQSSQTGVAALLEETEARLKQAIETVAANEVEDAYMKQKEVP